MIIDHFPAAKSFRLERKVVEIVGLLIVFEVLFEVLTIGIISWWRLEYEWSMFVIQYKFWIKRAMLGFYMAIKLKDHARIAPAIGILAVTDAIVGALFYLLIIVMQRTEK